MFIAKKSWDDGLVIALERNVSEREQEVQMSFQECL